MKRAIIFCWAFGLVLGMVKQTIAANRESSTDRMQFQEVNINLVGTAEARAHYFAGKTPRNMIQLIIRFIQN